MKLKKRTHYGYSSAYSGPYGGPYEGDAVGWTPAQLSNLRAWYDAELGQPLYGPDPYVQLDGASGDYIYTPDSANIRITGAFEVVMRVYCNDWTAAGAQTLIGRYVTSTNLRSWRVFADTSGRISIGVSPDGTSGALLTSLITPTNPLPDATWIWLRVTFLPDDGGGNRVASLFTAADTESNGLLPTSWTANGVDTDAGVASAHFAAATAPLEIGSFNNGAFERFAGRIGRAILYSDLSGTVAADFNASDCYGNGYTQGLPTTADGSKYVQLYGRSGDYIYTADKASLDITGDIEFVARVACENWVTGSNQTIIAKADAANDRAYFFYIGVTGAITVATSPDGTAANQQVRASATPPPAVAGRPLWVKATIDVDDGAGNRVYNFYYAEDQIAEPTNWTLLTSATVGGATSIYTNARILEIGTRAGGINERLAGKVFRAIVRNGIGGTVVADYNAQNADGIGFEDAYGNVWLHNNRKATTWTLGLPKIYDRGPNNHPPATFGSGSNQPTWMPWFGADRVRTGGGAGNAIQYALTDWAPMDSLVDFDMWADVEFGTLTPTVQTPIVERRRGVDPENQFRFCLNNTGTLSFIWFPLGTIASTLTRTTTATLAVATGIQVGERIALRATLDVDDGAGNHVVTFYYRRGGYTGQWTLLEQITTAGTTSTPTSGYGNRRLEFGGGNVTNSGDMTFYAGRVLSGIGGTPIAFFDAANCGQGGYTPAVGHVVTLIRAAAGAKLVLQNQLARTARAVIQHASNDWIDVPAAAVPALDTFAAATSVTASFRRWHNPGTNRHAIFATKASLLDSVLGFGLALSDVATSPTLRHNVGDGTASDGFNVGAVAPALGTRSVSTVAVGNSSPFVAARSNDSAVGEDTARATTGTTSTGGAGRIGAYTGGTGAIDMEFEALICRDVAATDAEHGLQVAYYGGGL